MKIATRVRGALLPAWWSRGRRRRSALVDHSNQRCTALDEGFTGELHAPEGLEILDAGGINDGRNGAMAWGTELSAAQHDDYTGVLCGASRIEDGSDNWVPNAYNGSGPRARRGTTTRCFRNLEYSGFSQRSICRRRDRPQNPIQNRQSQLNPAKSAKRISRQSPRFRLKVRAPIWLTTTVNQLLPKVSSFTKKAAQLQNPDPDMHRNGETDKEP